MTDHVGFVVAAYGATGLLLTVTIAWVLADYAAQRRRLADIERSASRRPRPGQR